VTVTQQRTFLGIPVSGEEPYVDRKRAIDQRPMAELRPLIDAAFSFDNVEAFRWSQFTPYFNDGEPCVFHVRGCDYKIVGQDDGGDYDDDDGWLECYGMERGEGQYERQGEKTVFVETTPSPPWAKALGKLQVAIDSSHYDTDLYKTFGDHAQITLSRGPNGIQAEVEFYEHY
jgi:hypothetical protein